MRAAARSVVALLIPATALLTISIASAQSAVDETIPTEPTWTTAADDSIITLEDDLAQPETPTDPQAEPSALDSTPALPVEGTPTAPEQSDLTDQPDVIEPAPEELDPNFFADPSPPEPPGADPASFPESEPEPWDETTPAEASLTRELEDDPNLGVPDGTGYYLPDLTNPLDPFFQMEGLKIRIGELHIRMPVSLSLQYDDNIFQSNTNIVADYISAFAPTLLLGIGDYQAAKENFFTLRYTPQFQFFAENSDLNTVNEFLNFTGQYAFPRLTTSVAFAFSRNSNPTSGTVGRRETTNYGLTWENSYALASKTFAEADFGASYQDDGRNIEYTTFTVTPRLAYQWSEKLRLGFGPLFGITYITDGGEQTFQGLVLSINYNTLRKFSFRGTLGVQARQFNDDSAENEDFITPTFSIGSSYAIRDGSSVGLDLSRRVGNSALQRGQSVISNTARISYNQRVLRRFEFSLALTYQVLEYEGNQAETDDFISARPSLAYVFFRDQISLALFYERSQRSSDRANRDFQNNTLGTSITFQF